MCSVPCSAAVVLEFDQSTYSVTEGEAVRVTIVRRGVSAVPRGFTVIGDTQDGSATGMYT